MSQDEIVVANAPAIPGLTFRAFRGAVDYPGMAAVLNASSLADRIERADTAQDIADNYARRLTHCDPARDMIFAEVEGGMAGYSRGWWWEESSTGRIYEMVGFLVPAWRRKGLGRAMLRWMEDHLRRVAEGHPPAPPKLFQVSASQFQEGTARMLEREGYQAIRYFHDVIRPSLDDIPDEPLPEGLELRPASPDHCRAVWASVDEASQDEWGYARPTEEDYQAWLENKRFQPHLWQIAWDVATEQVAGHVLTFIDHEENRKFNRKRGYTEGIGVGRTWRRRGLARALIARSLLAQKAAGMSESALSADTENASGATRLYEACGFRAVRRDAIYRKPV